MAGRPPLYREGEKVQIEICGISKRYGSVTALNNVSLSAKSGEIRGILGGNGSGKSTLVKIIAGLAGSGSGRIKIDGMDYNAVSPKDAKDKGIVMTSQELSILPNLTVSENLNLCVIPKQLKFFYNRRGMRERTMEMLGRLGLEGRENTPVADLPPNELYMLEFGKALLQDPKILLIDEITSALYRENVEVVSRILKEGKREGKIIFFITHRMHELYSICDTITVMRNGESIGTYGVGEKTEEELLQMMAGENNSTAGYAETEDIVAGNRTKTNQAGDNKEHPVLLETAGLPIPQYGTKISLQIHAGEIIGVAGLQGHGQSDLVRTLHGMRGPVRVKLNGREVHLRNPHQAVRHGFAFIPGDREREGVFAEHSIEENAETVCNLVQKKKLAGMEKRLEPLHVKYDHIRQPLTSLSGGNQQKVVFGRWVISGPKLFLADDPTKGIDVNARTELHGLLAGQVRDGAALLMVSSDDDELAAICKMAGRSRVIVMYEGQIVKTLTGDEITRENIIAAAIPTKKGGLAYEKTSE